MSVGIKVSGAFKSLLLASVRISGAWKGAIVFVRVGGVWKAVSGLQGLTEKGRGYLGGASATASLTLSYDNVISGSAPSADDLVIWHLRAEDSVASPFQTLTGWTKSEIFGTGGTDEYFAVYAKVLTAGDISSPPTAVVAPTDGSGGFWVAYSVQGVVSSIAVHDLTANATGAAGPASIVINASGHVGPLIVVGMGCGNDDTPTLAWLGAVADGSFTANDVITNVGFLAAWKYYASGAGNDITMSKSDDGGGNSISGAYIVIT